MKYGVKIRSFESAVFLECRMLHFVYLYNLLDSSCLVTSKFGKIDKMRISDGGIKNG